MCHDTAHPAVIDPDLISTIEKAVQALHEADQALARQSEGVESLSYALALGEARGSLCFTLAEYRDIHHKMDRVTDLATVLYASILKTQKGLNRYAKAGKCLTVKLPPLIK